MSLLLWSRGGLVIGRGAFLPCTYKMNIDPWKRSKDEFLQELEFALKVFNYFFTAIFIVEAGMKVAAL